MGQYILIEINWCSRSGYSLLGTVTKSFICAEDYLTQIIDEVSTKFKKYYYSTDNGKKGLRLFAHQEAIVKASLMAYSDERVRSLIEQESCAPLDEDELVFNVGLKDYVVAQKDRVLNDGLFIYRQSGAACDWGTTYH